MRKLKSTTTLFFTFLTVALFTTNVQAQCEGFENYKKDVIEDANTRVKEGRKAHVIYRGLMKEEKYTQALPLWEALFTVAPAGHEYHYIDGLTLYKDLADNEEDEAKKKVYTDKVAELYDGYISCYGEKESKATGRAKKGTLYSDKAYDMYYYNADEATVLADFNTALELEGNAFTSYGLVPFADLTVRQYLNSERTDTDKKAARDMHATLMDLIDHNIANNKDETENANFVTAKDEVTTYFAEIEDYIFDCDYFLAKFKPLYDADKNNVAVYRDVYTKLVQAGCDKNTTPILVEIGRKDASRLAEEERVRRETFQANNPGSVANKLYKSGDLAGAIAKYSEAITASTDSNKKSQYAMMKAKIERKRKRSSAARSAAREALKYNPNNGAAYMLIGSLYASSGRSCKGSDPFLGWAVSWAAVDQFQKAKRVDPSVAGEANRLIAKYSAYFPPKEECFMRKIKAGQGYTVGCWIGERTTVRYK